MRTSNVIAAAAAAFLVMGCNQLFAQSEPTERLVVAPVMDAQDVGGGQAPDPDALAEASSPVLAQRLEGLGLTVHRITTGREGRLIFDISGDAPEAAIANALRTRGEIRFALVDHDADPVMIEEGFTPAGSITLPMSDGYSQIAVKRIGGIRGVEMVGATQSFDSYSGEPVVMIRFNEQGTAELAQLTERNVNRAMAVILDDTVLMAPNINEPITGGQLQLSGGFDVAQAQELAIILQSGELPASFRLLERSAID